MVFEREGLLRALGAGTGEPVLLPQDGHRHSTEGQVDVGDHRALLDPRRSATSRTARLTDLLFDGDLANRTSPAIGENADIFEAYEVRDDLVRIEIHRGVEDLLFHTLRLKRLCAYAVDTR